MGELAERRGPSVRKCEDAPPKVWKLPPGATKRLRPGLETWQERRAFWLSVCENGAASEVVVNLFLPWALSSVRAGVLHAPSDFTVNVAVLLLNLVSAYLEGWSKSARLLTQNLRRSRASHQMVFVLSYGISLGFLNVSSSFPDVGGGASDAALAMGSSVFGHLYIFANMLGSVLLYRAGRADGWRAVQARWNSVLVFCRVWPLLIRLTLVASFLFISIGPWSMGHDVPLDLGDPDVGGIDNVRLTYDEYVIHLPGQALGLAFGIVMSTLGCVAAVLCSEVWEGERRRCFARLVANFASTLVVLALQHIQYVSESPSFVLMKFGSSFCGAFSAFSGTIGDVYDDYFGAPDEDGAFDEIGGGGCTFQNAGRWRGFTDALTGFQNFLFHWLMTVAIMMLGVYYGPVPAPPILIYTQARKSGGGLFARTLEAPPWDAGSSFAGLELRDDV